MREFACRCGNRIYFENTQCVACRRELGWCEACSTLSSLARDAEDSLRCDQCGVQLQLCRNYEVEQVCNRGFAADQSSIDSLCTSCQLTDTIPDLSIAGNRQKWARLEQAKRRLLYQLDQLELPYGSTTPRLCFDFKGDLIPQEGVWRRGEPLETVYTGHSDGRITINIKEADDVEREKMRVDMNEPQRTLIGHFRHEAGHYYWQLLVQGRDEPGFCAVFGDHRNPEYTDALKSYYASGPRAGWANNFISPYASSHPWEDFAETFALFLDMTSVLETAHSCGLPIPPFSIERAIPELVDNYQQLGLTINELNRCLEIFDLVPEIIAQPVVQKLQYIHAMIQHSRANAVQTSAV